MLGFDHEHARPDFLALLNRPAVYARYATFGWTAAEVDQYVFAPLDARYVQESPGGADVDSIMAYYFSPDCTVSGKALGGAATLSARDKQMAAAGYPPRFEGEGADLLGSGS